MKKLIAIILLCASSAFAQTFDVPVNFVGGSSINVTNGVPLTGTWDFSGASVSGVPQPANTYVGNVVGSGVGTVALTVATIPDLVSAPGSIVSNNISSPVAPSSGKTKWYTDSGGKRFHDRNDTGATGTTVVGATPVPGLAVTGIDPSTGVITMGRVLGHSIALQVDGQGSVISTGTKNPIKIAFGGTLQGWLIIAKPSGSVSVDIYRATDGAGLPTASIIGSGTKPSLSSAVENSSTSFTNWTSNVLKDHDNIAINIGSVTTCTFVSLTLYFQ